MEPRSPRAFCSRALGGFWGPRNMGAVKHRRGIVTSRFCLLDPPRKQWSVLRHEEGE